MYIANMRPNLAADTVFASCRLMMKRGLNILPALGSSRSVTVHYRRKGGAVRMGESGSRPERHES